MTKIIVKRGFTHEKIYYGSGKEVSAEIAKLFPEHVKSLDEEVSQVVEKVTEVKVEEVSVQPVSKPASKKKAK